MARVLQPSSLQLWSRVAPARTGPLPVWTSGLRRVLDDALDVPQARAIAEPFVAELARPERGVRALVLYGSCLWPSLRGRDSQPDFIVVVDSLRRFHRRWSQALLGHVLPPSIYRLRAAGLEAKLSVTSTAQLARHVAPDAPDLHHLGRLSKRVALVWSRDEASRLLVVDAQRAALESLAPLALSRFDGEVELDAFMEALLGLSYQAEVRIVERGKAAALFSAEREHYRAVGRALLLSLGAVADASGERFSVAGAASRAEVERRLRRSRRRAVLRWPKYLCTYDGWLEYVVKKLARTGQAVSLSERQKRHPLLFGLPVLVQLARTKRLR